MQRELCEFQMIYLNMVPPFATDVSTMHRFLEALTRGRLLQLHWIMRTASFM
jgi:hypothetical protein